MLVRLYLYLIQSKLQIGVFLIHYTSKLDTNEYTGFKKQD